LKVLTFVINIIRQMTLIQKCLSVYLPQVSSGGEPLLESGLTEATGKVLRGV
jgi:hypothetical protein